MDEVVLVARCDLCDDGARAAAVSRVVVGIATNPATATTLTRPDLMVVDLCELHVTEAAAADLLAGHGRPLSRRHTAPAAYPSGARMGRPATSGGHSPPRQAMRTPCPAAGCGSVVRRNNIGKHLFEVHGWRMPRQPKRCPDCGHRITEGTRDTMQGHRARSHHYDYLAALIEANP